MGKDKFENEDLIKWGLPTDIWFHVDGLSSAHVYLRLPDTSTYNIDTIPNEVLQECLTIVKWNSIEGCKLKGVKVSYTPWANLEKNSDMEVGAVGFKNKKDVRYSYVEKDKEKIKELKKTYEEKEVDLEQENFNYYKELQIQKKKAYAEMKKKQEEEEIIKAKNMSDKRFEYIEKDYNQKTNKQNFDDDFM